MTRACIRPDVVPISTCASGMFPSGSLADSDGHSVNGMCAISLVLGVVPAGYCPAVG